jgi:hypothetical protein
MSVNPFWRMRLATRQHEADDVSRGGVPSAHRHVTADNE